MTQYAGLVPTNSELDFMPRALTSVNTNSGGVMGGGKIAKRSIPGG
jgi:hypothetical protein